MPAGSGKFRRWQQLAEKARFVAEWMHDPQARQIILGVALAYECLAEGARKHAGLQGVHPHTLRHSCGCYLAVRTIQGYLGHRDPRHTVHYTRIAGRRFEGLWK